MKFGTCRYQAKRDGEYSPYNKHSPRLKREKQVSNLLAPLKEILKEQPSQESRYKKKQLMKKRKVPKQLKSKSIGENTESSSASKDEKLSTGEESIGYSTTKSSTYVEEGPAMDCDGNYLYVDNTGGEEMDEILAAKDEMAMNDQERLINETNTENVKETENPNGINGATSMDVEENLSRLMNAKDGNEVDTPERNDQNMSVTAEDKEIDNKVVIENLEGDQGKKVINILDPTNVELIISGVKYHVVGMKNNDSKNLEKDGVGTTDSISEKDQDTGEYCAHTNKANDRNMGDDEDSPEENNFTYKQSPLKRVAEYSEKVDNDNATGDIQTLHQSVVGYNDARNYSILVCSESSAEGDNSVESGCMRENGNVENIEEDIEESSAMRYDIEIRQHVPITSVACRTQSNRVDDKTGLNFLSFDDSEDDEGSISLCDPHSFDQSVWLFDPILGDDNCEHSTEDDCDSAIGDSTFEEEAIEVSFQGVSNVILCRSSMVRKQTREEKCRMTLQK